MRWQDRGVLALTVVIPTRNRPLLAAAAVRSVLDSGINSVRIVVSDNSTEIPLREQLRCFCSALPPAQVSYIESGENLSVGAHWEWALHQAIGATPGVTHITYLTDRMLFKRGMLRAVAKTVERYPNHVITYNHDRVDDTSRPVRLLRCASTGRLYQLTSSHLLELYARVRFTLAVPRMLNCVVPMTIVEAVRQRFGTVCESACPDFCFAFRCLEVVDQILFFDQAALIQRALDRSTGESQFRGTPSAEGLDFIRGLGGTKRNDSAPIPEFETLTNLIVNEYCVVKDEANSAKFPEVDRSAYLSAIAGDVRSMANRELAARTLGQLEAHGWRPDVSTGGKIRLPVRLAERAKRSAPLSAASRWAWYVFSRAHIRPSASIVFRFPSTEAALKYEQTVGTRDASSPSPKELFLDARVVESA